jgi:peptide/nickel transport system substrate-binding protein
MTTKKTIAQICRLVHVTSWVICLLNCNFQKHEKSQVNASKSSQHSSLTIGISQEPDSLFMPYKEMMASEEISRVGTYTLTIFDEKWKLIPWVAKEIPTLENKKLELFHEDGQLKMRSTWELKDDFFWADGKPLTADDFVFTYEIYKDPSQEIIDRTVIEKIEKMESKGKDRKILVVTWKEPYAYYHNYRQHEAVPKHIVEPIYKSAPEKLKKHSFGQTPLLAGPYSIKEWIPGSHIIATKNLFAKGYLKPRIDEIVWRIIPQTNTLESNLVSGTIDAISPVGLDLDQALEFEKRHGKNYNFYYTSGLVWEHIDFNLDNEILKDKRVRHALAYGANREGIAQLLFRGKQIVAHGTEPQKSPYHNDNIKKYPFDQTRANQLLTEAGWTKKEGERIRSKNGKPLVLTLMTTAGNKSRERIEQLLQSQWREIGVDIQIQNQPAKVFFGDTLRRRKYVHMAMYSWVKDPVAVSDTLWRCDYIPSSKNGFSGQNQSGFCNSKADQILKSASLELDDRKRAKIGQEFEKLWAEELPSLPLFFRVDVSITKKGLKNWKPTGILQPITWNSQEWSWK